MYIKKNSTHNYCLVESRRRVTQLQFVSLESDSEKKKKRGIFTRRRCVGAEIQNHAQFCSCFVKCMFKYRDKRDISRAIVVSGNILGTKRHRYQKSFSVLSGEKWMQFKLSMGVSYRKVINLLCNNKLTDFQFVKYVMILCLVSVFVLTKLFDFVMLLIT